MPYILLDCRAGSVASAPATVGHSNGTARRQRLRGRTLVYGQVIPDEELPTMRDNDTPRIRSSGHLVRLAAAALLLAGLACAAGASEKDRRKWDGIYAAPDYVYGSDPLPVLVTWRTLLAGRATGGRALDVAAGECQNGVYLARMGYRVDCVDISAAGLAKGRALAARAGVADRLRTVVADLETHDLDQAAYDCIVNTRFVLRRLAPLMIRALKPGGVLIFESFTEDAPQARSPGADRSHFLARDELLSLFAPLRVIHHQEKDHMATLVARKPLSPVTRAGRRLTLDELAWMVGHWRGVSKDSQFEEVWSRRLGDSMLGMFRLVAGGTTKFYELIALEDDPTGPVMRMKHFDRGLKGWEAKDQSLVMPLKSVGENRAVFETPDGQERLIYSRPTANSLLIRLEKLEKGLPVSVEFRFSR
ncbi:MAG: class I SAM-dependent methyltransferase [Candidatus Riflebacteria bacterium]|nr:class I SAM-dependent methyltransferase [Candidatus Riflebacteria bacterium]